MVSLIAAVGATSLFTLFVSSASFQTTLHSGALSVALPGIVIKGSEHVMPPIGFGTCCRKTAQGPALVNSTLIFLRLGGRHIDTAQKYSNHKDIRKALTQVQVPREELWITSKINTISKAPGRQGVMEAVNESLRELGLNYLDLMLLHRPANTSELRAEQWRGLIDARAAGKVRNIGVSNYDATMIQGLIDATGVTPAMNQISYNPLNARHQRTLVQWCQNRSIAVTAYSSVRDKTNGDVAIKIAETHKASPAQVLLRWALDQGVAVIPGATSEEHILDNLSTGDFRLSTEEVQLLERGSG